MSVGGPARQARAGRWGWTALVVVTVAALVASTVALVSTGRRVVPAVRAIAALGTSDTVRPSSVPALLPVDDVAAVLERRTQAVRDGDEAAFLADVDRSDADFVADQRRLFANLKQLPLARVGWRPVEERHYPNVAARTAYGAPTYVAAVEFGYRLGGFDRHVVRRAQALTFVERDGRWVVAADDDVSNLPEGSGPEPWDVDRIAVVRTPSALVIGSADDRGKLRSVARQTGAAVGAVRAMWRQTGVRSAVVYVPRDRASLDAYFPDDNGSAREFDAIAFPVLDQVTGWFSTPARLREAGNRIVLNTDLVALGAGYLPTLLRHEVTHVATSRWTFAQAPLWLVEGAAEYTSYRLAPYSRRYPAQVFRAAARGRLVESLPLNVSFYSLRTGYDRAFLLCFYVQQTYGEKAIVRLYRATGRAWNVAQTQPVTRRAFRDVLGVSESRFLRDFNLWAQVTVRSS